MRTCDNNMQTLADVIKIKENANIFVGKFFAFRYYTSSKLFP